MELVQQRSRWVTRQPACSVLAGIWTTPTDLIALPPPSASLQAPGAPATGGKAIGNYVLQQTLGQGTFGKVKLALHKPTGSQVAIKILEKARIKEVADAQVGDAGQVHYRHVRTRLLCHASFGHASPRSHWHACSASPAR